MPTLRRLTPEMMVESGDIARVNYTGADVRKPLLAAYTAAIGTGPKDASDDTLMIAPPPSSRMKGSAALVRARVGDSLMVAFSLVVCVQGFVQFNG